MRLILFVLFQLMAGGAVVAAQPPSAEAVVDELFDVLEFVVEGNSKLASIDIERAVYPHLGPGGGIRKVELARAQLEKAYHDAGFLTALVDIPEQQVMQGVVRLSVTEGSVERLRVVGSRYYSLGHIRSRLSAVAEGTAPDFPEFQQQLARLNRSADRRVTPVLKPGRTPGTARIDLNVEDRLPLHGSVELNNRYSANTTRLRLSGSLRYDNLWQRDHSLGVNIQTTPLDPRESKVLVGSYTLPVPGTESLLAFYAVSSSSNVASVGGLNVIGDGTVVGARGIMPLPAIDDGGHTLTLGADYKRFSDAVTLQGADTQSTPISYTQLTLQYSATRQSRFGTTQSDLAFNFAPRGLFGNRDQEFANKRFKARSNYAYLRGGLQHTLSLPADWQLSGRIDAQFASQPLISNEQFSAGGQDSVRGYLESQQLGDDGMRGTLELRGPSLVAKEHPLQPLYLTGFIDGARLRVRDPLPQQTDRFSLSSAGLGLRFKAWKSISGVLDLAWPFTNTAYTSVGSLQAKFRLWYEF